MNKYNILLYIYNYNLIFNTKVSLIIFQKNIFFLLSNICNFTLIM